MKSFSALEMLTDIFNFGCERTNNLFFVEGSLYWEVIRVKQQVFVFPGCNKPVTKTTYSSEYLCWNLNTHTKTHVTYDTFKVQLELFKYLIQNRPGYYEEYIEWILDNDLTEIAILSEHTF